VYWLVPGLLTWSIGFTDLLVELGISGLLRAGIVGSIIGRMAAPSSEAATHHWLKSQSALGLLDVDFERMTLTANPEARHGRSNEKRRDFPLVTLELVLDESGFVQCSETFAGTIYAK
jgi:hypothetical protein